MARRGDGHECGGINRVGGVTSLEFTRQYKTQQCNNTQRLIKCKYFISMFFVFMSYFGYNTLIALRN